MGFFSGLFKKKENNEHKTGGMEDYMYLVRVYFQASSSHCRECWYYKPCDVARLAYV